MSAYRLVFLMLCTWPAAVAGQELSGRWYSADSSRIYYVFRKDSTYHAVLEKSTRSGDQVGTVVLSGVKQRVAQYHRGIIHTVEGDMSTLADIRFEGNDTLRLRLRRFLLPVKIRWYRVTANAFTSEAGLHSL